MTAARITRSLNLSPVYLGDATGAMRALLERLVFPYLTYTPVPMSLRIDTLEHSLAASGTVVLADIGPDGYMTAAALAVDNLNNGLTVVVDSVNPRP